MPVSDLTDVVQVSAGSDDTCALLAAGTVDCWGKGTGEDDELLFIAMRLADGIDLAAVLRREGALESVRTPC